MLAAASAIAAIGPALGQPVDRYFPSLVPGFDQQHGLSDLPQPGAAGTDPAVHVGGLRLMADLAESLGVDSNVDGLPHGPGSGFYETAPAIAASLAGPRGRLALDATLDDVRFLQLPRQDRTDWTLAVGGTYALGRDALTLGYAHLAEHELPSDLGSPASAVPIPFTSEDARALYTTSVGRLVLTPNVEVTTFRYGGNLGQQVNDRTVISSGIGAAYPLAAGQSFDAVLQEIETDYRRLAAGQNAINSRSWLGLAGIESLREGPWHYRLLVGFEYRSFAGGAAGALTTPIAAANATWRPTHRTALTATLTRVIDDAASAGLGSYTRTDGELALDQVVRHDVTMKVRFFVASADYRAGGSQRNIGTGISAAWLLSRRLRLQASYDFTDQGRVSGPAASVASGGFAQNRAVISIRVAL